MHCVGVKMILYFLLVYILFIHTISVYSFFICLVHLEVENTGYVMDGGYEDDPSGHGANYENQNVDEISVHPKPLYRARARGEDLVV